LGSRGGNPVWIPARAALGRDDAGVSPKFVSFLATTGFPNPVRKRQRRQNCPGRFSHIRSASIKVTREARRAGSAPPRMPTKAANSMPCSRIFGVMRKLKSTSLKFVKLAVPVEMPCKGNARMHPTRPPSSASNVDSSMKEERMLQRENPSARRVPTSLVRERTVAYIIFIAAKQDPTPMTTAIKTPSALIPTDETAWLLKYSF